MTPASAPARSTAPLTMTSDVAATPSSSLTRPISARTRASADIGSGPVASAGMDAAASSSELAWLDRLEPGRWHRSPDLLSLRRRAKTGLHSSSTCLSTVALAPIPADDPVLRDPLLERREAAPRTMAESAALRRLTSSVLKAVHSIAQGLRIDGRGKHRAARTGQQIRCVPSRRIVRDQDDGNCSPRSLTQSTAVRAVSGPARSRIRASMSCGPDSSQV